ncbi:hypothetical protein J2046_006356 [Rhizobium petrolearium]|nr:hypothetical protein [Neorhizobium petrolearium]
MATSNKALAPHFIEQAGPAQRMLDALLEKVNVRAK